MKREGVEMISFPASATDITVDWMNEALASGGHLGKFSVVSCEAADSEVPGQTAEIATVSVEYDDPACPLPRKFVAKLGSRNPAVIESVVKVYDLYRREAAFYSEIPEAGIAVPECYLCAHDPSTQQLVILMKDLAPAVSHSWAAAPDQIELAASRLPAFHARWWNDPKLRRSDWLVQFDDRDFFFAAASAGNMAIPKIEEAFGEEGRDTLALLPIWLENIDTLLAYIGTRPYTLVHGDYHPKQMFFPTSSGGEFAVIDWQFPFVAQGAWDLIRIMVLGLDRDVRRDIQSRMVSDYHRGLVQQGITDYSMEDLETDVRLGLVVNQMIMSVALIDTDISLFAKECTALGVDWKDVLLLRGETAVRDWDVVEFLRSLV